MNADGGRRHGDSSDWLEKAATAQPFGRLLDPTEAARAVDFIASEDAGLMTGAVVHFDQWVRGGYESSASVSSVALSLQPHRLGADHNSETGLS